MNSINIYMDESGDLGFNSNASSVFIIAYYTTEESARIRTETKRLLKKINNKKGWRLIEFKFSKDNDYTRKKFFELIKKMNIEIGYIVIYKNAIKDALRDKPNILYNDLVGDCILTNISNKHKSQCISLVIDKSLRKEAEVAFNNYVTKKLSLIGLNDVKITLQHVDSQQEPCIQVADYLAGAAFSKFERCNSSYYDIIKDKIVFKNSLR